MKALRWKSEYLLYAWGLYAFSTLVSMAFMSVAVGILAGATLIEFGGPLPYLKAVSQEVGTGKARRFFQVTVLLTLVCVLSLISAAFFPIFFAGKTPEIHGIRDALKLWYLFIPWLWAATWTRLSSRFGIERVERAVFRPWFILFLILSVVGIVQYFIGWPRKQWIPDYESRFHTTLFLGHHLSVASIWIFPFFLVLDALAVPAWIKRIKLPIWFFALTLPLGFLSLFFTHARSLWWALPISLAVWIFYQLPRKGRWMGLGTLVVFFAAFSQHPAIYPRIRDMGWAAGHRMQIWEVNWEFFKLRPWLGVGFRKNQELAGLYLTEHLPQGSFILSGHAHNNAIEMLSGTGILGLLLWLLWNGFMTYFLIRLVKEKRTQVPAVGILCAWIAFHLNGITQVNFWEGKVLHQFLFALSWAFFWRSRPQRD